MYHIICVRGYEKLILKNIIVKVMYERNFIKAHDSWIEKCVSQGFLKDTTLTRENVQIRV